MIEKNYNEAVLKHEPAAVSLIKTIFEIDKKESLGDSSIYHEFPFYRDITGDGIVKANILFASKRYGIFIFQCFNTTSRGEGNPLHSVELANLEALDTLIYARLIKSDILKKSRRELKLNITPVIYVNTRDIDIDSDFKIVSDNNEIEKLIVESDAYPELTNQEYCELKALIEGSKVIPRKTHRKIKDSTHIVNSKGAILSKIESEIANFDTEQKRAALFTLDSPQRIRGLAGSGKTIILAMKAALIHIQEPKADILYTYYTKALQDYVKKLITRFYRMFCEQDPNWEKIHVIHAWGGKNLGGVYYNACRFNSIPLISFRDAKNRKSEDPFSYVCEDINNYELNTQYEYALLDEAQDFPKAFYQLCRKITNKSRVIWAYDDFQNILDVDIQNEKETFGKDHKDEYYIDFSRKDELLQDLILHKCYRNPRKNLITAFALGLGIYNDNKKVLQRLENNEHWESLGFKVEEGDSGTGAKMVISRPFENSPLLKNELLEENIFKIKDFDTTMDECEEVIKNILEDLNSDLLPEDIAIICLDSKHIGNYFEYIINRLNFLGIETFSLLDAPTDNVTYRVPKHVTLSTIFKAKGNESGSVYIIGIDAIFRNKDSIVERNKLFTAITRSEAWVMLTGLKPFATKCIEEYHKLVQNNFKLIFRQPSKESTRTILRDISLQQQQLNQMERITEELKKLGLTEDEIKEKFLGIIKKK